MTDGSPTRILLVDDHDLFREGLRELLSIEDDLDVFAGANNGAAAVTLASAQRPDMVILDVNIPGDNAATTVRHILEVSPDTRVVILSLFDDPAVVRELLAAGAHAYLLKSVTREDLVSTLRSVAGDSGRMMLSISRRSFEQISRSNLRVLSDREVEIVALVAKALSNSQIARRLTITEGTVKRHLRNIFAKLGAVSRIDAVNKAIAANELSSRSD
ncbi:response regulator transcription factor [Actinoplanes sp. NEAU-A12]|uniref:Response regulator transcription factor n=1 Tax=Actinoplanes sandaracinus TaxID=3045177 RepID=A0ABT6WHR1_9ACTN|nr:response regulator transcription factor [Actinoplanes sandaracinus]MDI6099269.1 response regulator transcription factor [Actinoplanes sandaracinus]